MFHKKKTAHIITGIFAVILILQTFGFMFFSIINEKAEAKTTAAEKFNSNNPLDNLQVEIPGLKTLAKNNQITCNDEKCYVPYLSVYISAIYKYAIGSVGILSTVVLMYAGILWITAAGNASQVSKAKSYVVSSLTGMVLAFTSYTILYQVSPELVSFKGLEIASVEEKIIEKSEKLQEGDTCTLNQAPFCDYGLVCSENKCIKTEEMEKNSQSGEYRWIETSDCSNEGKINYGDNYCPSPKPDGEYNCCGKY